MTKKIKRKATVAQWVRLRDAWCMQLMEEGMEEEKALREFKALRTVYGFTALTKAFRESQNADA
jgi:hypothetical protein